MLRAFEQVNDVDDADEMYGGEEDENPGMQSTVGSGDAAC